MLNRLIGILFLLSFSHTVSSQDLGDEAYGILLSSFMYDATYPLNVRTAGKVKSDGIDYERIVFDSFHNGNVPGLLSIPTTGQKPYPIVLLLHGLTSSKSAWLKNGFNHGSLVTKGLIEKGYAVFALDAQYHGDRAVYNDYINPGEMIFQRQWGVRYSNMVTQTVVDYRRAIDYLATRDDIDTDRVGVVGYSMGGHMTFLLGASEPRVKTIVGCVIPEMSGVLIAASTFVRGLEDKPLLMMMARKDQFYTVETAQNLFDSIPGKNKTIRFFNSGHSLPERYARQVVDWVGKEL